MFAGLLLWRFISLPPATDSQVVAPASLPEKQSPETTSKPAAGEAPAADAADTDVSPEITTLTDETSARAMLLMLFMQLEGPMREWAESRGVPRTDANGNFMLDQPYQQYDEETLRALANNGDMWAQQILAGRIAVSRPAEAMELYRQAAAQGSVFAMLQLAELASTIGGMSPDFEFEDEIEGADNLALDQYYSLRDAAVPPNVTATAWRAVAEMAGLPGFMRMSPSSVSGEEFEAACDLAGSIYTDLLARRASAGLGGFPTDAPPAWIDGNFYGGASCEHEQAVQYDFSGCRQIRFDPPGEEDMGDEEQVIYVCDGT